MALTTYTYYIQWTMPNGKVDNRSGTVKAASYGAAVSTVQGYAPQSATIDYYSVDEA